MQAPETIVAQLDQYQDEARALVALLRQRPDLIAYAHGSLYDMGEWADYEIAEIITVCTFVPSRFAELLSVMEYFMQHIAPKYHPAMPPPPPPAPPSA